MKRFLIILVLCLAVISIVLGGRWAYIKKSYPILLDAIESKRLEFVKSYELAKSDKEKEKVLDQARSYLNETLQKEIFPAWYGTPWSFYGNTKHPLRGSIACGAFVENVLRHAGFVIAGGMSAQPSENIIKNICDERKIERFSNVPMDSFNKKIKTMGEGIFIVGLDTHVGFLYVLGGKYRFVHSHGNLFVLSEIPSLSPTLRMSRYRVVGKLFTNKLCIEKWLYGKKIGLKYDYFRTKN